MPNTRTVWVVPDLVLVVWDCSNDELQTPSETGIMK
jgi:hypothetical protein